MPFPDQSRRLVPSTSSEPSRRGVPRPEPSEEAGRDAGQATTEYALVLLGAAVVALLLVAWATQGGGAGKIGLLLDHVLDVVRSKAS